MRIDDVSFLGKLCKNNHNYNSTGFSRRFVKDNRCTECRDGARKRWYSKNTNYVHKLTNEWRDKNKNQVNCLARKWRKTHKERCQKIKQTYKDKSLLNFQFINKKSNAKRLNICFDLTLDFITELWNKQEGKCFWFNIPIFLNKDRRHPLKATIDRLDPSKGYTLDNVVWASALANIGRGNCPIEEFREITKNIVESKKII